MNRDAAQLRDEIRLREASLNDALSERAAGELNAEQFETIRQREGVKLEAARNELGALMASADPTRVRRRVRRTRWLAVALVCFATVLICVVVKPDDERSELFNRAKIGSSFSTRSSAEAPAVVS